MMEKTHLTSYERIDKKIENFNIIWETVTRFSNLSRMTTKQWREL
jgi:hypothetical protein